MFNTDLIIIILNILCLDPIDFQYLMNLKFYFNDPWLAGYIKTANLSNFLMDPRVQFSSIHNCIVQFSYDLQFQIEQTTCTLQHTNTIYYNQTLKPNAWDLDFFDIPDLNYLFPNVSESIELWILDTGINWKHKEFEEIQVLDTDPTFTISNITNPHGTGTAACAGGRNYGASKSKKIYNYPVCRQGGSCAGSDIDKGFHFILSHLQSFNSKCNTSTNTGMNLNSQCIWNKRAVINLSVGSYVGVNYLNSATGQYYNQLFKDLNDYGAIIFNSAGNSNQNACEWMFSFSDKVISVGSISQDQSYPYLISKSGFSNWGLCIDLWSYGSNVPTAYSTIDNTTIQFKSGTSFSSPLAAGLAVNILNQMPNLNRYEMLQYLSVQVQNFTVTKYNCLSLHKHCCSSKIKYTRKSKFCENLNINECVFRECQIIEC
jgi:hypothetical protein